MDDLLQVLFRDYEKTQLEYTQAIVRPSEYPKWNGKKLCEYSHGVVVGKYRERDTKTLNAIEQHVSNDEVKRVVIAYYHAQKLLLKRIKDPDIIQRENLRLYDTAILEINILPLDEWLSKYQSGLFYTVPELRNSNFIGFIYIYYAYENYLQRRYHPLNSEQDNVDNLYEGYFNKSSQFQKYGLLPIDEERELLCCDPPQLYDKEKNKTMFLRDIPFVLAEKLKELLDEKIITELAVRVSNKIFDGKIEQSPLLEEVERGKMFSLANLGIPEITKLYSKQYEDCLWVIIETQDITFEELCEDFQVFDDQIVTQVIHLQYNQSDEGIYITHLDHEYIFYTFEEFDSRRQNANQKGSARARMKTFKIDNSCIPFQLYYETTWKDANGNECTPVSVPFICFVLDCYFQHKELIMEYFRASI